MEPFWEFSLRIYAQPGVANGLLALQERRGADVNLLLYCAWHAASGRGRVETARLAELDAAVARWRRTVLVPLRGVRNALKPAADASAPAGAPELRQAVLALELQGEKIAQEALAAMTGPPPGTEPGPQSAAGAAARSSLAAYLSWLGGPEDPADAADLAPLLAVL